MAVISARDLARVSMANPKAYARIVRDVLIMDALARIGKAYVTQSLDEALNQIERDVTVRARTKG